MNRAPAPRRLLVIDTAYTFAMITERGLADFIVCRDLEGYFDHVWAVHPFASLFVPPGDPLRFGRPDFHRLAPRHTLIEGKVGRFAWLGWSAPLNFLFAQIGLLRRLSKLVRDQKIGLIRAEDSYYSGLIAWYLARRHKLPLAMAVWGNPGAIRTRTGRPIMPRLFRRVRIEQAVEQFLLKRADVVLVQNEDNRNFVLSVGVPRERTAIFRLGNAVHPVHFVDPADRGGGAGDLASLGIAPTSKVAGCIARLIPEKMLDHVVRAAALLKEREVEVHALFIGDGLIRDELAALARELGVAELIHFAGNRDQDWLARVIPHLDAVVSPVTGRALAEAGLGGAPVVAYAIDWQPEVIRTGETGELVSLGDYRAMADAIERVVTDREYASRIGANLRREMSEMMDPEAVNRAQMSVYEQLLRQTHVRIAQRAH